MHVSTTENAPALVRTLESLVEPIADFHGVELVDVEFNNGVAKIVIDEPDGVISQSLIDVTKAISRMLDDEDPIPGRFTLEVTSPGVERPLKRPQHFQRAIGEEVSIKTRPEVEGDRRVEGDLVLADGESITVKTAEDAERTLRYGEIQTARTVFHWGPTPKKGGPKSPNGKAKNGKAKKGQQAR